MSYLQEYDVFLEELKQSIENETFAKLTMAKTIGKPELKNIFVRPIYAPNDFKVLLKLHYAPKEIEDIETEYSLEEAIEVVTKHLRTPFLQIILFTTEKDLTFKINKKGAGSITENFPTFQNVVQAKLD
ncbi:hypothetical protein ACYSNM_11265 [Myroides sp. LJL116]